MSYEYSEDDLLEMLPGKFWKNRMVDIPTKVVLLEILYFRIADNYNIPKLLAKTVAVIEDIPR